MFRIAVCRQAAILEAPKSRKLVLFPTPPAPKHQGAAHMRRSQPCPCFGCCRQPDASGRNQGFGNTIHHRCTMHGHPLRTPKTKRPRARNPRAFALASGDRGDRSPRVESVFSGTARRDPGVHCAHTAAHRDWIAAMQLVWQWRRTWRFLFNASPGSARVRTLR